MKQKYLNKVIIFLLIFLLIFFIFKKTENFSTDNTRCLFTTDGSTIGSLKITISEKRQKLKELQQELEEELNKEKINKEKIDAEIQELNAEKIDLKEDGVHRFDDHVNYDWVEFQRISASCNNVNKFPITDSILCSNAAKKLNLTDTNVNISNNKNSPYGCYYEHNSSRGKRLWLNLDGKGTHSSNRRALCFKDNFDFVYPTSGNCDKINNFPITNKELCRKAAKETGRNELNVNEGKNLNMPYGCYYKSSSSDGQKLWLNLASEWNRNCVDPVPGWVDKEGHTCADWVSGTSQYPGAWCAADGTTGSGWNSNWGTIADYANDGHDPTTACCGCGARPLRRSLCIKKKD
jgi:hypothetical protein